MVNYNNTENELKKQILQLKALNKIFFDLIQTTDLDVLLNKIIKYAAQIVESDGASILLLDKEKKELYFKASLGKKSQEIKKYKVKVGQGIAGWVAEKGETLIVNNVNRDSKWNKDFDNAIKFQTKSIICIPLKLEKEIIGVIELINKKDRTYFNKNDEEILNFFADQAVIALENANIIKDLNNYFVNIIEILIQALESEPLAPKGHFMRIVQLATQIGNKLGATGKDYENIYYAFLLHDIGKIKIEDTIDANFKIKSNFTLNRDKIMRMHPAMGANMLKQINLFKDIIPIIRHHHENYDGTGYPNGLKGKEIPLGSRIIAVVEEYMKLSYNKNIEDKSQNKKALNKLFSLAGTKYDPKVINALKEIVES